MSLLALCDYVQRLQDPSRAIMAGAVLPLVAALSSKSNSEK